MNIRLFSIVIPCFNYGNLVGRALDSVLMQDVRDTEVIVVDDGSRDESWRVISDYAQRYPKSVRAHRQENRGPAAARNAGIRLSSGRYLCFLDADDEMTEGALAGLRSHAEQGEAGFIVGGHFAREEDGREVYRSAPEIPDNREAAFTAYLERKIGLSNGSTFFHRRVFDGMAFPEDLRQMEDIPVFALLMALHAGRVVDLPLVRIHKHMSSLRHDAVLAARAGLQVVDVLFDNPLLPESLRKYRRSFAAKRALSLFRTFGLAGDRTRALEYFARAVRARPAVLFQGKYLARFVSVLIGAGGAARRSPP